MLLSRSAQGTSCTLRGWQRAPLPARLGSNSRHTSASPAASRDARFARGGGRARGLYRAAAPAPAAVAGQEMLSEAERFVQTVAAEEAAAGVEAAAPPSPPSAALESQLEALQQQVADLQQQIDALYIGLFPDVQLTEEEAEAVKEADGLEALPALSELTEERFGELGRTAPKASLGGRAENKGADGRQRAVPDPRRMRLGRGCALPCCLCRHPTTSCNRFSW